MIFVTVCMVVIHPGTSPNNSFSRRHCLKKVMAQSFKPISGTCQNSNSNLVFNIESLDHHCSHFCVCHAKRLVFSCFCLVVLLCNSKQILMWVKVRFILLSPLISNRIMAPGIDTKGGGKT